MPDGYPEKLVNYRMKSLAFVYTFARKYQAALVLTVFSMLLLVGAQLLIPWIIRTLINIVSSGSGLSAESLQTIGRLTLLALAIYLVKAGLQYLRLYLAHIAGWGVVADLREHVYDHLQRLNLRYYNDKQTGQMMSRVVNDTDLFEQLIAHAAPDVFVNALTLLGVGAVLFSMNWKLALLALLPIPLIIFSLKYYARRVRPAFVFRQKELGELNAILSDSLSGIREIKAFSREGEVRERVGQGIQRYRASLVGALRMMAVYLPFVEFTSSIGVLVVIYFGGRLAFQGSLPVADLVAFFLYLEMFYQPVRNLSNAWEAIQNSLAGADRVTELLAEEPEPLNIPGAIPIKDKVQGQICFENVSFQFDASETVLENIQLEIPAHHMVALVGPTGVGKTTMVSLIPRFYDVVQGRITLDGHDIRDIRLESLRKQISIVLQDVFLFHGTVRDNILFGRLNATEEEMMAAARAANADEFIDRLPNGYDTLIGERGTRLSGGQKQRLSIARAVLKDSPILILDEATSAVDTETELLIQQALERLMVGRTTILIAHRLSTIRKADRIVVLEGKHVVEMGRHEELMKTGGLYRRLVLAQQQFDPLVA
jgi:ATP-binding cassette subfamily B protein/subfamily B ATP-binding cassette protein MsbA